MAISTDTDGYVGFNVRKYARDPRDQAEVVFHATTGTRPFDRAAFMDPAGRPVTTDLNGEPYGPPARLRVSMAYAAREPFIERVNARPVVKPGGPADDPWRVTHTFIHADELIFHMVTGDHRYRVVRQPDKYAGVIEEGAEPTDAAGDPGAEVRWYYDADLVEG